MTIEELIARLEKIIEPDRALDEAIWRKFGGSVILVKETGGHEHHRWMDRDNVRWADALTHFTRTLDCAFQLVPGPIDWELKTARHRLGYIALLFNPQRTFRGDAATPETALCIAALRTQAGG